MLYKCNILFAFVFYDMVSQQLGKYKANHFRSETDTYF